MSRDSNAAGNVQDQAELMARSAVAKVAIAKDAAATKHLNSFVDPEFIDPTEIYHTGLTNRAG